MIIATLWAAILCRLKYKTLFECKRDSFIFKPSFQLGLY
nr:MAG TPA: hypothetical protein [Caudoviricetes sp.]